MTGGTIQEYVLRRRSARRAWIAYTIGLVLLILRGVFEFAFDGLTGRIVTTLADAVRSSTVAMAVAGWLTIAFLPLAADILVRDRRRRLGIGAMTTRARSKVGHHIARPSVTYWIRRIPMLVTFALALLFWPLTGASMANRWVATPGGVAFSVGWRVSLVAAALGILVLLAEPWITTALRGRSRLAVFVLPLAGLAITLILA